MFKLYKAFIILGLIFSGLTANADVIKLIVPFAQGGSADLLARQVQKHLLDDLGKTVVVEYRAGASGEIGSSAVANADSKDLVLLLNGPGIITTSLLKDKLSYNESNLVPLVHMGYVPFVVVVSKKSGIKNFKELQNLDANRPIFYGSSGHATASHLAGVVLQGQVNKNLTHVPYKGTGQAIPDLISGNLDALLIHWTSVAQLVQNDQITALAIESDHRIPELPNVPTMREFGLSNFGYQGYLVLFSNATTDLVLQKQVQQSVSKFVVSGSYTHSSGYVRDQSNATVSTFFQTEKQRYSKILKNLDVK